MPLAYSQNVGINTTTPSHPIHVVQNSGSFGSRAVFGVNESTLTTQQMWGVVGETRSTALGNPGAGVYGWASATTGGSAGVRGEAASPLGRGLFGWATSGTGVNYGIYATTSSAEGFAGYFSGGKNYFEGNVGIGTDNPAYKLHIIGTADKGSVFIGPNSTVNDTSEIIFSEDNIGTYSMTWMYDGANNRMKLFGKSGSNISGSHFTVNRDNGYIGIGTDNPVDKFHVAMTGDHRTALFTGEGLGIDDATVYSTNTAGIAGFFESNGADAAFVVQQLNTSGSFMKFFGPNGGEHELIVSNDGTIDIFNGAGVRTINIDPYEGATTAGSQIGLYNGTGTGTIFIDGDYNGDGRVTTQELEITGGSDITENFHVETCEDFEARPGMLVSIDPDNPGRLVITDRACDRRVAGIISGAGGIESGFIMSQKGSIADGDTPVAIAGRVYCLADARFGKIKPGDLLTSSPVPGYAMKVKNPRKAAGAVIGKAMTALDAGQGEILVLVTLQ